jgi:hypothetical protein
MFKNVHVVKTKGANVAQWNVEGFSINEKASKIYINNDELIFYHFSGLTILSSDEFNLATFNKLDESPLTLIYMPYIKNLTKQIKTIDEIFPGFDACFTDRRYVNFVNYVKL